MDDLLRQSGVSDFWGGRMRARTYPATAQPAARTSLFRTVPHLVPAGLRPLVHDQAPAPLGLTTS